MTKTVIADNFASDGARAKLQRPACSLRRVEHVTMFFGADGSVVLNAKG